MTKEVVAIRHALKDMHSQELSNEGRRMAVEFGQQAGSFDIAIAGPKYRARETAYLITGIKPQVDQRAGGNEICEDDAEKLRGQNHPLGVSGIIFESKEYHPTLEQSAHAFIELVRKTLELLPEGGRALIISHDITLLAVEKILRNEPITNIQRRFGSLQGIKINEMLELEDYNIS